LATIAQAIKHDAKFRLAAILFGMLLPLSMAPFDWSPLGIISIAGLTAIICDEQPARTRFMRTLCFGLGVYGVGASWIYISIHDYGQASVALSLLLIVPFIVFLAALLAIPFFILSKSLNSATTVTLLLTFPSLWTLGEWFRGWAFTGFPWLYLGYGHTDTWLSGWAPITGVLGISWITAFCGALLALLFIQLSQATRPTIHHRQKTSRAPITIGLCGALMFWVSGWQLQTVSWTQPTGTPLTIGLVQPATPLSIKWDPYKLPNIFKQLRADTELLLGNDLIVWPESAIPRFRNEVQEYLGSIAALTNDSQTALITGIPTAETNDEGQNTTRSNSFFSSYYNSVIGLGLATGTYHKQHLVPFGEYVPFEKWLRGTIAFFDLPMSVFSAGPKNQPPITAKNAVIATAICYEIAYPELVRASAVNANLLLTLSNDTWFGKSIGPKQHFQIARMRAIENGKPLIRATNDGISALVTADGAVSATIPPYQRDILEGTLEPRNGLTPFGTYGAYPVLILSGLILFVALCRVSLRTTASTE
jgi:apolipoprotein N-acyltransferase